MHVVLFVSQVSQLVTTNSVTRSRTYCSQRSACRILFVASKIRPLISLDPLRTQLYCF